MKVIGIDIGAQKTMMVADDADIVLTDTGSINRPTLVAFSGQSRLVGEEAAPQIASDSTIAFLNLLIGKLDQDDPELVAHRRVALTSTSSGLSAEITYCGHKETLSITAILAIFLAKLHQRIKNVYGDDVHLSFALIPSYELSVPRAIKEACQIANINESNISFVDSTDCIIATYGRKLQALRGSEKSALEGKKAILIEIGHSKTTIVVALVTLIDDALVPSKLSSASNSKLGCIHFDMKLFKFFADICLQQNQTEIVPGTKRGQRLLFACERARKLLSQLPDAKITVENLTDAGDVNFSISREDFSSITADLIASFKGLLSEAICQSAEASVIENNEEIISTVAAVEIVGGGVRMPTVQSVISSVFGDKPLGAKFDDASIALGAALLTSKALQTGDDDSISSDVLSGSQLSRVLEGADTIGLTSAEVEAARASEIVMQKTDAELQQQLAARNAMESFILEMRSAKRRKHGDKIDAAVLEKLLDESEDWMWQNPDVSLSALIEKDTAMRAQVNEICREFLDATERDRVQVEEALEAEAVKAEAEKIASGEGEEDNDNRKLRKPDRMRMVVKNKDEGTELFKGGNYRPAAARYHKALTHCAKFFDLSPDDEAEVKGVKATLYLNLASCYLKLENWDQAIRNCNDAIELEPQSVKAYFRRSSAYEARKEWDKALEDIKKCQVLSDVEDKMVTKAADRIKKEIQKAKEKEKKMWGNAFKL